MNGEPAYVSDDDYGKLVTLLDERRKLTRRQLLAKKRPSRHQHTLAEKLEGDRKHKAKLAEINRQIDAIKARSGP